uniref:Protein KRTCAP2 homolog n=1 Tax=Cacopsylla melanoneura TaxID=428564 RepID=A0A8D8XRL8_9HEMI
MALSTGNSFIISLVLTILIFSGMQMYRQWLSSSQLNTILGGLLGSLFFLFSLTGLGNLESAIFGKNFQTKLFPEVIFCLFGAVMSCATSCIMFSIIDLYYMQRISQKVHVQPMIQASQPSGGKKKKN